MVADIIQRPLPGCRLLRFCGDQVCFSLEVPANMQGDAYVRTNLGHARITRQEIIRQVELNDPCLGREWFHNHPNALIRAARGLVFLHEMSPDEFSRSCRELRQSVENR